MASPSTLVSSERQLLLDVLAVAICPLRQLSQLSLWAAALQVGMLLLAAAAADHTATMLVASMSAVWVHVFVVAMMAAVILMSLPAG